MISVNEAEVSLARPSRGVPSPHAALRPSTDSIQSKKAEPTQPSSEEELDDYALYLYSQGLIMDDDDDEEAEEVVSSAVSRSDEQIVDDLLISTGAEGSKMEKFGENNDLIAYDSVSFTMQAEHAS